jgi:hypothetical protein
MRSSVHTQFVLKCVNCSEQFPTKVKIDGKVRVLNARKYCLTCSPFGAHNTQPLPRKRSYIVTPDQVGTPPAILRDLLPLPPTKKPNSKARGDITTSKVTAALVSLGYPVLLPWGDNERYDLVIDTVSGFKRIQCKTGRYSSGHIAFNVCSSQAHRGGAGKSYHGEVDLFGVYCAQLDKVFLVPIDGLPNQTACWLRVDPMANKLPNVRWARDYEIRAS